MSANIIYAILVTSIATFLSRILGVITSQGITETSKIFRWFNCLAYATLAALIARTIIFPAGVLSDASYLSRLLVVLLCLGIFFITKKNFVYPTIFSAISMQLYPSKYLSFSRLLDLSGILSRQLDSASTRAPEDVLSK